MTSKLDSVIDKNLGNKLATIEQLRSLLDRQGIDCPGVLVVGAKSAGKSSVLERLTGISFPRSENLCTRFPTIVHLQTDETLEKPVGYVSTDPGFRNAAKLHTVESIKDDIILCSASHMSSGCKIGDRPIHIRYIRPTGPVMTLIDLPGITHINTTDDDIDIHSVTTGMVENYIKNENMVVLVVIPANDDFGNSEALRVAQKYDEEGTRTIGVISKCDLVSTSSDLVDKIRMTRDSDVRLSLGFVAVRNKGAAEAHVDISSEEKNLFTSHPVLKKLEAEEWGYESLCRKIVELQCSRVNEFILEAGKVIQMKMNEAQRSLNKLGNCPKSESECRTVFMSVLLQMNQHISNLIKGETTRPDINISARTFDIAKNFAWSVQKEVPDLLGAKVRKQLKNEIKKSGFTLTNFNDSIVRKKVNDIFYSGNIPENVEILINDTVELMSTVLENAVSNSDVLKKFAPLGDHINEKCLKIINNKAKIASDLVGSIVESERSQIFTQNDQYLSQINDTKTAIEAKVNFNGGRNGHGAKKSKTQENKTNECLANKMVHKSFIDYAATLWNTSSETVIALNMQISLQVYSDIIMKRLFDIIPMVVRHELVHSLHSTFIEEMQSSIDDCNLTHWFHENMKMQQQRKLFNDTLTLVKDAQEKLKMIN